MNVAPITATRTATLAKTAVKKATKPVSVIVLAATVVMDKKVKEAYKKDAKFRKEIDEYAASKDGNLKLKAINEKTSIGHWDYGVPEQKSVQILATESYSDSDYKNEEVIGGIVYNQDDNYKIPYPSFDPHWWTMWG